MRALVLLLLAVLLCGCDDRATTHIRVEQGWVAEIPPMLSVTAAWMVVHNDGEQPAYLIGAYSPNAESIEIHQSVVVDDMARMVFQPELEIPPRGSLSFDNDTGYHLMLYNSRGISAGAKIPVTLTFRDGSALTADFVVMDRRARL